MNLLKDSWIPIQRLNGHRDWIAPWQITEGHESDNPVVALAASRADFNGSLFQFLIGILQTAFPPEDEKAWAAGFKEPPSPEALKAALEPFANYFEFDGEGPRFLQDYEKLEGDEKPISGLFIEAPGAKTLRDNLDLFIKRGRMEGICDACAAAALFTLQTNAPSGGVGHRTSLRGGGPLTTLVLCDPRSQLREALWRDLWLNVLEPQMFEHDWDDTSGYSDTDRFPWLAPTRVSDSKSGRSTMPLDVHPLQMYWAMPRRIRLDFEQTDSGTCDVCGRDSDRLITHYRTKNYGVNYEGSWRHPLSPYSFDKQGQALPQHPQPGGIHYRHWLGLIQNRENESEPALVVKRFSELQSKPRSLFRSMQFRLWAFGFDMDNMKARCWYESTLPLYHVDSDIRPEFEAVIERFIEAAVNGAGFLRRAIKEAWFKRPGDARGDFSFADAAFWQGSESAFYRLAERLSKELGTEEDARLAISEAWLQELRRVAVAIFDDHATSGDLASEDPGRIARARNKLRGSVGGKPLRKILELPAKAPTSDKVGEGDHA